MPFKRHLPMSLSDRQERSTMGYSLAWSETRIAAIMPDRDWSLVRFHLCFPWPASRIPSCFHAGWGGNSLQSDANAR
jgi:hypothetical protein